MSKSPKLNLILILIIVLGTIGIYNFAKAVSGISRSCTGTTECTSWGTCISGVKTCNTEGYSLLPKSCSGSMPAPTSTCSLSESIRNVSGYAWSENVGYISFSGDIVAGACITDSLTRTLQCGSPQTGTYTQTRTSVCPSGASAPITSDWVTTDNECVAPCTPMSLKQTLQCDSPKTGTYTQTRTSTCPSGALTPITSDWVTDTPNTCVAPCVPESSTQIIECPISSDDYGWQVSGSITQTRTSICSSGASTPITSSWITTGTTCLEWYRNDTPSGNTTWSIANTTCAGLSRTGGSKPGIAWRLPSIDELSSNSNMVGLTKGSYWSGTTNPNYSDSAQILSDNNVANTKKIYSNSRARCVR